MIKRLIKFLSILMLVPLSTGLALAKQSNPYLTPDDTWLSLSGVVESVSADSFLLDYGDGYITVEMDDGDRDADAYVLVQGDKVTVNGIIDNDLYETRTIEAANVYVEKLDTFFYASPNDEEDMQMIWYTVPVIPQSSVIQGVVSDVDDNSFTVNTGTTAVTVMVDDMHYDPLDDQGYQKIDTGDIVRVTGKMENEFFEDKTLKASSIVTIIS